MHDIHLSSSITGYSNPSLSSIIEIAFLGHIEKQAEHPQHSLFVLYKTGFSFIIFCILTNIENEAQSIIHNYFITLCWLPPRIFDSSLIIFFIFIFILLLNDNFIGVDTYFFSNSSKLSLCISLKNVSL